MKSWLKGGIINLIIFIVLLTLSITFPNSDVGNVFSWILLVLGLPAFLLSKFISIGFGSFSSFFILVIPYSFLLGALIGWVIGKVKSRRVK